MEKNSQLQRAAVVPPETLRAVPVQGDPGQGGKGGLFLEETRLRGLVRGGQLLPDRQQDEEAIQPAPRGNIRVRGPRTRAKVRIRAG